MIWNKSTFKCVLYKTQFYENLLHYNAWLVISLCRKNAFHHFALLFLLMRVYIFHSLVKSIQEMD